EPVSASGRRRFQRALLPGRKYWSPALHLLSACAAAIRPDGSGRQPAHRPASSVRRPHPRAAWRHVRLQERHLAGQQPPAEGFARAFANLPATRTGSPSAPPGVLERFSPVRRMSRAAVRPPLWRLLWTELLRRVPPAVWTTLPIRPRAPQAWR